MATRESSEQSCAAVHLKETWLSFRVVVTDCPRYMQMCAPSSQQFHITTNARAPAGISRLAFDVPNSVSHASVSLSRWSQFASSPPFKCQAERHVLIFELTRSARFGSCAGEIVSGWLRWLEDGAASTNKHQRSTFFTFFNNICSSTFHP